MTAKDYIKYKFSVYSTCNYSPTIVPANRPQDFYEAAWQDYEDLRESKVVLERFKFSVGAEVSGFNQNFEKVWGKIISRQTFTHQGSGTDYHKYKVLTTDYSEEWCDEETVKLIISIDSDGLRPDETVHSAYGDGSKFYEHEKYFRAYDPVLNTSIIYWNADNFQGISKCIRKNDNIDITTKFFNEAKVVVTGVNMKEQRFDFVYKNSEIGVMSDWKRAFDQWDFEDWLNTTYKKLLNGIRT